MDNNTFWQLIEKSRKRAEDCEEQAENLIALLAKMPPSDIVEFDKHFHKCLDNAYRWDLWAVAYIVHGGCSDDSFEYFRCWLIGQGQIYFEAALENAESAANNIEPGEDADGESLLYAASQAHEEATGEEEMPDYERARPAEPAGTPWDEEKVDELYPKLAKKFA